ncbi:hypothetical protein NHF48_007485 [Sphingomonas sp. H160509]|uniref:hypothetical protein n=1 Tax=Sphingomonas sp. H160509 TaxID=2955313 RepID=UPI0021E6D9EF|nr:hypothetical protein [Sphingomonas sp. H160509]MDD1450843.1 hypothetical protein [Sphingomonas sp. H160509]
MSSPRGYPQFFELQKMRSRRLSLYRAMISSSVEQVAMAIVAQLSQGSAFDDTWRTPLDAPRRTSEN